MLHVGDKYTNQGNIGLVIGCGQSINHGHAITCLVKSELYECGLQR